jgi:hypothetical protein
LVWPTRHRQDIKQSASQPDIVVAVLGAQTQPRVDRLAMVAAQ